MTARQSSILFMLIRTITELLFVDNNHAASILIDLLFDISVIMLLGFLRSKKRRLKIRAIKPYERIVESVHTKLQLLLEAAHYIAHRDIQLWTEQLGRGAVDSLSQALRLLSDPSVARDAHLAELKECTKLCLAVISGESARIKQLNAGFVQRELTTHRDLFDEVETLPLTDEQRIAAIVMEDRNLLVAAAGSGKTSAVIGKIGYILETKMAAPDEILVLAFNNDAARELEKRNKGLLGGHLKNGKSVKTKTFHALGLEIIAETEGVKPSVSNLASDNAPWIDDLILELQFQDGDFAADWATFLAICPQAACDPHQFKNLEEWDQYVRETSGGKHYRTFKGEPVKSQGELAIANWLYTMGVPYQYEKPYEFVTADKHYGQYKPDFTLPSINCYLEHLALDDRGNPPRQFEKYEQSLEWKRSLHATKGTALIETTFADFVTDKLFPKLEQELASLGAEFSPYPPANILERVNGFQKTQAGRLLRTFIKHAKSSQISDAELMQRAQNRFRERIFAQLATKVRAAYEARLQEANELDFEDLIVRATQHIAAGRYRHNFRFILIDEFQDISQARGRLIKSLLDQAPNCKLFCVGDDWQSIYRFAGSDLDVFTEFSSYFGKTATHYLTKTFRSNQGIADVAAGFVQKNRRQLAKSVAAQDETRQDVIEARFYKSPSEIDRLIDEILSGINGADTHAGERHTVYILGRYNSQRPDNMHALCKKYRHSCAIEFKTIHKSKGRQADYVILLGLESGRGAGFPSEMADDPVLRLVMPQVETYPNADERRLFYVALTRAKHKVYLLGNLDAPSAFLSEVCRDYGAQPMVKVVPILARSSTAKN